jgi:uncharacterized protein (DUF433 family)
MAGSSVGAFSIRWWKFHDRYGRESTALKPLSLYTLKQELCMHNEYIERRDRGYYVAGTRISLDSVVCAVNRGDSPERILEEFPLLDRLSRVYGVIALYLDHKDEVDKYLKETEREFEAGGIPMEQADPVLWEKIQRARAKMGESHT